VSSIQGSARLGNTPTLKFVGENNDKPVCEINVRLLNFRKNKSDPDKPHDKGFWAQLSVWGNFAESASQQFVKGDRIFIADGDMSLDTYTFNPGDEPESEVEGESLKINCNLIFPWTPDLIKLEFKARGN
jgi:single-stranded DNA-binding protein